MIVNFYEIGTVEDTKLAYAAIITVHNNKFVYVRHQDRETWEIPGGRREKNETINETGLRELKEETGAEQFNIHPLCEYSVTIDDKTTYGRMFFCIAHKFGELPNFEIEELRFFDSIPNQLTYPGIQPSLQEKALELIKIGL